MAHLFTLINYITISYYYYYCLVDFDFGMYKVFMQVVNNNNQNSYYVNVIIFSLIVLIFHICIFDKVN